MTPCPASPTGEHEWIKAGVLALPGESKSFCKLCGAWIHIRSDLLTPVPPYFPERKR